MELSETEQRLYGELFDRLEDKNAGGKRVTGVRASELFLASGLPPETLHRITELCGAKRLGHFGRSQFYIALKLIAAAQAGLPIAIETIGPSSGNDIPLPKFSSSAAAAAANKPPASAAAASAVIGGDGSTHFHHHHHHQQSSLDGAAGANASNFPSSTGAASSAANVGAPVAAPPHLSAAAALAGSTTGVLPPPPNKGHMRSLSNQRMANLTSSQGTPGDGGGAAVPVISSQPQLSQQGVTPGFRVGGPAPFSPGKPPMSPSAGGSTRSAALAPVASPGLPSAVSASGQVIITQSTPMAPLSPHEPASIGAGVATGEVLVGAGPPPGGPAPTLPHNSFVTDNNMNTSAKGWVPFDEEDAISMGIDASSDSRAAAAAAAGDGEERSSSFDTTSLSSASDTEDVWTISDEQREYYIAQFKTMQADVDGLIHGGVAKVFFEKSRLPIHELSKIWQLSDVTRDGALNLEEFCTCMHLVVLRRNEIEIPDTLPSSLLPFPPIHEEEAAAAARLSSLTANLSAAHRIADLEHHQQLLQHQMLTTQQQQHHVPGAAVPTAGPPTFPNAAASASIAAPVASDANAAAVAGSATQYSQQQQQQQQQQQPQQWAQFSESPTSSILSSPGSSKPLNFDFQKPLSDESSKIAHPVPVKGSQQQPQQPQPHNQMPALSGEPPPPPPRPRLHSRENSLDFNKQFQTQPQQLQQTTQNVQQQQQQQQASVPESLALGLDSLSVGGVSEAEGVIRLDDGTELPRPQHLGPISREGYAQLQDLTSKIRKLKDFRQQLIMTNNEMNQELQEVMEQRIGLEIQFEHLMHRNDFL